MSNSGRYLTTHDVAEMLGVSAPTVIKWIKQGWLEAHSTPGGHRRVALDALQEFATAYDYPLPSPTEQPTSVSERLRILIVDREPDFSEMVAEYLEMNLGCDVVSGGDALHVGYLAGQLVPDVVLYDMDCVSVDLRRLMMLVQRQNPKCRLFITTTIWSEKIEKLRSDLAPEDIIEKPFKLDVLTTYFSQ